MARSITEIQNSYVAAIEADAILSPLLTSTSLTALFLLMVYVWSFVALISEQIYDLFTADINEIIANKNPHTQLWYTNKAKDFQLGYELVPEKDYYDNTGIADDVVAASKIVKYAAMPLNPFARMKVAKLVGTNLAKLTNDERAAFVAYILRIKDAGVKLKDATITSTDPDNLKYTCRVIYDPLILNAAGQRIDGSSPTPVKDAIKNYLQNLDFNGQFSVLKLEEAILAVPGVKDLHTDQIQSKYGALPFTSIDIERQADSGYFIIEDADLDLTYFPE